MISNQKPLSNINQLLQMGLATNLKKLPYYRIVMQDPKQGIYSMIYREQAIDILNQLIDYVLNDSVMYNRLRSLLATNHRTSPKAFEALITKAEKSGIDLTTILEVYEEGYNRSFPSHLTQEQRAFNHVNKYIAEFTIPQEPDSTKREEGSTGLADLYAQGTPGQSSKSLEIIRRTLKDKK